MTTASRVLSPTARPARLLERAALGTALVTLLWGPLAQGSTFGWGFSGLTLLGGLTCLLTLLAVAARGRVQVAQPLWVVSALALLAWIWASVTWAPYTLEAQRWAGVWTAVLGASLSLHLLCRTRARQTAAVATLLLGGGAAVVVAVLQARGFTLPGYEALPGTPREYLTGPYFHPSHFSGYLIPVAALTSTALLCSRPSWSTPALLLLQVGVQVMNLRTDGSSIPAVILAGVLPIVVWAWTKRAWLGAALTVLALGGVGAALFVTTTPTGTALFNAHKAELGIHSQDMEGFLAVRRSIHHFGGQMWAEHPATGVGVGQFVTEFQKYRLPASDTPGSVDQAFVNYAHSDYLQMLSELGTPGLALFLLFLLTSVLRKPRGLAPLAWISALATLLLTGLYDSHLTAIPGTMLVAFALAGLPSVPVEEETPGGG
ncbi:hypothetical protein DAETH_41110 (plasmid) [Deinococcus aetherius]|uniref:O-antigen ligase-related domain-containing protein n=1 Tax=Deinococcus aetherius TaxID=200252 RepID=A0ABM8AJY6_9DEIO|nr:O-antigen ligase family protein [Deinococcus aetherius]BDP44142.1 hypothetical protein DAETH_41110 [Deinococcus aetherius]